MKEYTDVYQKVTDRIIEKLQFGVVPWQRPWEMEVGAPANLVSKRPYRGMNIFLLSSLGFGSPYFLSFKQVKELGGSIRKGEKASLVVFSKWIEAKDDKGNIMVDEAGIVRRVPILKYYYVFNVLQCEKIPENKIPKHEVMERTFNPIKQAETIVKVMPKRPAILYEEKRAYYSPINDTVHMPKRELFHSDEELYSTLFHELVHATGHESRLKRSGIFDSTFYGDNQYSREELVAEMGAAFLCTMSGIENKTIDNSANYINSWLQRLKNDRKLVVIAAGSAQKACDFILNRKTMEMENGNADRDLEGKAA